MSKYTWDELEAFVRREADVSPKKNLTKAHTVEHDLGITGDDAVEFINNFFNTFPVKPGDFDFSRYFCEEGFSLIEIVLMVFSKKTRQKYDKVPLTLEMLYLAISDGDWNSERLESLKS